MLVNQRRQWLEETMQNAKTAIDQVDTELLVRYVVSEEEYAGALAVIERFRHNPAAVNVFRNYYAELPEGREEMACDLRVVAQRQGSFIFALKTTAHCYLYFGSGDTAQYIGEYRQGIDDEEVLLYFGFADLRAFRKKTGMPFDQLASAATYTSAACCVVCGVPVGDVHVLGCPVEQCPWCQGQLNRCNCRFDQLGVEEVADEELLERFAEILEAKGRIAFQPDQCPAYPTAGNDVGPLLKKR